ncbi:MAG TPA: primosomal protein N' [Woeseiaceae bacterium]|nr:primosomal protein N' [Woeseiaceae bacterium]
MNSELILKVAVPVPLSRLFDYLGPLRGAVPAAGSRVIVSFGRGKQVGLVVATGTSSSIDRARLKRVESVLDDAPLLPAETLWLLQFTSDYYHHPIGEVAAATMPALLRQGRALYPSQERLFASASALPDDIERLSRRAPKQAELLSRLLDAGEHGVDTDTLSRGLPNWRRAAQGLMQKGLIEVVDAPLNDAASDILAATPGPSLNAAQLSAVEKVNAHAGFTVSLLDGVTGSGKTEVYLRLIEKTLEQGAQVLVLVPEIGLTPQLVKRFRDRLGFEPALLHSSLGDSERLEAWRRARSNDARLLVGTRSAIFTPMPKLGLIIVDEEHDQSLKQQEGLLYSARDLAIARAKHRDIPIVLGSATPTLEMQKHCIDDNYQHLILPTRAGGAKPPRMHIVDISPETGEDGIGEVLATEIRKHLAGGGQVLLFLNRRGFAPTLICPGCGELAECRRCDARMTVHVRAQRLRCHHCGASRPLDELCSNCGSGMRALGAGTERLEDTLSRRFPEYSVTRIDSDSMQGKGAMHDALTAATLGDADILVGTQMLSKGHHFPKLTLVGVINADQGLFGTDFRADERMAQSIIQVAGRAGREQEQGEVLIQTAFPAHPFWRRLVESGYAGVSADALKEREATHWPPYSRLALIRSSAHKQSDAHRFLDEARQKILKIASSAIRVLGPVDAVMARKAGRYRAQLLLQTDDRQALHALLTELRPMLEAARDARKVRWSIDVDPIALF